MKKLTLLFLFAANLAISQSKTSSKIDVPDSIKLICDKVLIKEAGEKIMNACIKFNNVEGSRNVYENGEVRLDYTISYIFSYPEIKEATVPLVFIYSVYSGKGHLQSRSFLRTDRSDLPKDIQKVGINLLSLDSIKANVIKADSLMKDELFDFVLGQDGFYWHFHRSVRDTGSTGDMESYKYYNVIVDPYTGKVTSVYSY